MKAFTITKPFCGYLAITIEAETEEEALKIFDDKSAEVCFDRKSLEEFECEWEVMDRIVQGNVCYAQYHEMEIDVEDIDE
jgi:hypothetical protein